jgi:hypothetical protein
MKMGVCKFLPDYMALHPIRQIYSRKFLFLWNTDVHHLTLNSPYLDPVFSKLNAVHTLWDISEVFYWMMQSVAEMYSSDDGRRINYKYEAFVEWYWQGKTEVMRENLVPVPFCPQMPLGLSWDWTWASTLRGWWWPIWAVAQFVRFSHLCQWRL